MLRRAREESMGQYKSPLPMGLYKQLLLKFILARGPFRLWLLKAS